MGRQTNFWRDFRNLFLKTLVDFDSDFRISRTAIPDHFFIKYDILTLYF